MVPRARVVMRVSLIVALTILVAASSRADFGGYLAYRGGLGPVGVQRPLCLCLYTDPSFTRRYGCAIYTVNERRYGIGTPPGAGDYYLVAFLDVHINERLDPDEPFEIFRGRAAPPGDPVSAAANRTDVDFIFGDENLPGLLTASATPSGMIDGSPTPTHTTAPTDTASPLRTETATADPTQTVIPSPSQTPPPLPGDCNADGIVSIDELVAMVRIALGLTEASRCPGADLDGDGVLRIAELVSAVRAALAA